MNFFKIIPAIELSTGLVQRLPYKSGIIELNVFRLGCLHNMYTYYLDITDGDCILIVLSFHTKDRYSTHI